MISCFGVLGLKISSAHVLLYACLGLRCGAYGVRSSCYSPLRAAGFRLALGSRL